MSLIVTKGRSLEVDEALAKVIEAARDLLSAEISCLLHKYRKLMAAMALGVAFALLGVALIAVGIRDGLVQVFPNYGTQAVIGAGAIAVLLAIGLLRTTSRIKS